MHHPDINPNAAGQERPLKGLKAQLFALTVSLLLVACTATRVEQIVHRQHFVSLSLLGEPFLHQLYFNNRAGETLHIYIEGDGTPWLTKRLISPDPTPDNPVMLELMAMDTAPAVYLGRPCYFKLVDPECSAVWWTDRRYSEPVVASMNRVMDEIAEGYRDLVLVGHSGGGALAMLLAARRDDVRMVVTLAGNLDVDAWARHHGHTALRGSLSPHKRAPLKREIRQLHLIGEADSVVTVNMLSAAVKRQADAEFRVIKGADHACCWHEVWAEILLDIHTSSAP